MSPQMLHLAGDFSAQRARGETGVHLLMVLQGAGVRVAAAADRAAESASFCGRDGAQLVT